MKDDKDLFEDVPYQTEDDLFEDVPFQAESSGTLKSAALGALEQGTFGFGDEIGGAIQEPIGAIKKAASYVTGTQPDTDVQNYEKAKAETQQAMDEAYAQNPVSYGAGAVASMLVPGAGLKAASTGAKVAAGSVAGALSGVGQADQDLTSNALSGAASGAAVSGALLGTGKLLSKGADVVSDKVNEFSDEFRRDSVSKIIEKFKQGRSGELVYGEKAVNNLAQQIEKTSETLINDFKEAFKKTGTEIGNIVEKYSPLPTQIDQTVLKKSINSLKKEAIDDAEKLQLDNLAKNLSMRVNGTVGGLESARKYLANEVKTDSPALIQSIKKLKDSFDNEISSVIKSYNSADFDMLQNARNKFRAIANAENEIFGKRGIRFSNLDQDISAAKDKAINFLADTYTPDLKQKTKTLRMIEKVGAVPEAQDILRTVKSGENISKKIDSAFSTSSGNVGKSDPKNILADNIEKSAFYIGKAANYTPDQWGAMINNMSDGTLKKILAPLANSSSTYKSAALFSLSQNPATRNSLREFLEENNLMSEESDESVKNSLQKAIK